MELKHVVGAQRISPAVLKRLFHTADEMRALVLREGGSDTLKRRVMATLFYEPSTRTRLSFEAAMRRLGGKVITTEAAAEFSSAVKGERLKDTIQVVGGYADVIVLRHKKQGSAAKAASVSSVPIINAGDGAGQHPTQMMLDLYTIQKEIGRLENLAIAMVGDLRNGRTVRSLCYILTKFQSPRLYLVSPRSLRMRKDIRAYLRRHGVPFEECDDLREVAGRVDVVYLTRVQAERMKGKCVRMNGRFQMDPSVLERLQQHAIIMHPLPRVDEIRQRRLVDIDPRAAYFRQAHNGLYVRMALLKMILAPDAPL
ncbi:MAG: aspartate carbamoyltransferase [Parcubacteria group bacterium]|nr:aspartate carbamoyltransferase [Parcubacteria group bacterium]